MALRSFPIGPGGVLYLKKMRVCAGSFFFSTKTLKLFNLGKRAPKWIFDMLALRTLFPEYDLILREGAGKNKTFEC